jgi:hypothetical protein
MPIDHACADSWLDSAVPIFPIRDLKGTPMQWFTPMMGTSHIRASMRAHTAHVSSGPPMPGPCTRVSLKNLACYIASAMAAFFYLSAFSSSCACMLRDQSSSLSSIPPWPWHLSCRLLLSARREICQCNAAMQVGDPLESFRSYACRVLSAVRFNPSAQDAVHVAAHTLVNAIASISLGLSSASSNASLTSATTCC